MFRIDAQISMPAPYTSGSRFARAYRAAAKDALKTTLLQYRQTDFKEHIKQTNRSKFNHKPRSKGYKAYKKRVHGSITDLKKTGETKGHMLSQVPKISIGGTASTRLSGTMSLKFPFPVPAVEKPGGVTIRQMALEIGSWDMAAVNKANKNFLRHFNSELKRRLQNSPTIYKRVKNYL